MAVDDSIKKAKMRECSRKHYQANKAKVYARNRECLNKRRAADEETFLAKRRKWHRDYYQRNKEKKSCHNKAMNAKHKVAYGIKRQEAALIRRYGITNAHYNTLFNLQNGLCAICNHPETKRLGNRLHRLSVDHDHATGKIRSLLCDRCNRGIAAFYEDASILELAIAYLKSHDASPIARQPIHQEQQQDNLLF